MRAPSATPAPDSTYVVTLETPIAPPPAAAAESTSSSCFSRGGWPFSSSMPPALDTATAVPIVSKKSLTNSTKITGTSAHVMASARLLGASASPIVEKSLLLGISRHLVRGFEHSEDQAEHRRRR